MRSKLPGAILKIAILAQRHARGRNGLPLRRRSCDGARATSSVSTVATLALRSQESRPQGQRLHEVLQCHPSLGPSSTHDRGTDADRPRRARWAALNLSRLLLIGRRCPATDFEQVCGAAQAALRGYLALSMMWYVLTVSQVGTMARFE